MFMSSPSYTKSTTSLVSLLYLLVPSILRRDSGKLRADKYNAPSDPKLVTGKFIRFAPPPPELPKLKKRPYEVYFPNRFTPCHPCGGTPFLNITYLQNEALSLPIQLLCHVTHEEQADQINFSGKYYFKPHQKVGKSYSEGDSFGETYRYKSEKWPIDGNKKCYRKIAITEPVFPGFYSWWGLSTQGYRDRGLLDRLPDDSLPTYLKDPPESWYGNHAFYINLSELLLSYKTSRQAKDIYLKIGGTLRYGREICYVVIVCTEKDLYDLHTSSSITHEGDIVIPNGLVGDDGRVIEMENIPHFNTRYVNTWDSYETLTFAFYFSSEGECLQCDRTTCAVGKVNHFICYKKIKIPYYFDSKGKKFETKLKCPNEITAEDKTKQEHALHFARKKGVSWP